MRPELAARLPRKLRRKLETNPAAPRLLLTVRGAGYQYLVNP